MATTASQLRERRLGETLRRDTWWAGPAATAGVLLAFAVYGFWAAAQNANYEWGPYHSPFYSPLIKASWWPYSPAFLVLLAPLGFRATCYYFRKAYYRAFFLDPAACSVGEARHGYKGETGFFTFQNLHRFFLYLALILVAVHLYDSVRAMIWPASGVGPDGHALPGPKRFGVGVGSLVMLADLVLLSGYVFGCHAFRHMVGGGVDCFSCARAGGTRFKAWSLSSILNRYHMQWAWISLIWVALTDVYIRLCASGVIADVRLI